MPKAACRVVTIARHGMMKHAPTRSQQRNDNMNTLPIFLVRSFVIMTKNNLQAEMASALKAAVAYSIELESLQQESRNSEAPDRELQIKIRALEKSWMQEMDKHSAAYKQLCSLRQSSSLECHGALPPSVYGLGQPRG
jgi:predicted RNase H-like nuclease (RuvC/YqgF family)